MPRQRSFSEEEVVNAAKELFWEKGYRGAGLTDLEARTGLSRSSIYHTFGDKRRLFDRALDLYLRDFIGFLLAGMNSDGAGLAEIEEFFGALASWFRADADRARRGCLMVNTIAELARGDKAASRRGADYRDRVHRAFLSALEGAATAGDCEREAVAGRADMLVAATLGVWLEARLDPSAAAARCDSIAAAWRSGPP